MKQMILVLGTLFTFVTLAALAVQGGPPQTGTLDAAQHVASVWGEPVTHLELDAALENRLAPIQYKEYQLRRAALDELVDRRLLLHEAKARGITVAELEDLEVSRKVKPVTSEEALAKYRDLRDQVPWLNEGNAVRVLTPQMTRIRATERRHEYLKGLREKAAVRMTLPVPRVNVPEDGSPRKGPRTAAVTIVEFSDYQCPACAQLSQTLQTVMKRYPEQVSVVFKDYPLSTHEHAPRAAEAARCAGEQGAYWTLHELLFKHQSDLSDPAIRTHASSLGIDPIAFSRCVDSGKHTTLWQKDKALGASLGVTGTPTLFLNGRFIGSPSLDELTAVVEEELAHSSAKSGPPSLLQPCGESSTKPCSPSDPRH